MTYESKTEPVSALTYDNLYLSEPNNQQAPRSDAVNKYLMAATSKNTRKAYWTDLQHFMEWGGVIPAEPELIAEYLAAHAEDLAASTLARRLAAISKAHSNRGMESPTKSDLVRAVMKGVRRTHGKPSLQKAPILKDDVVAMVQNLGTKSKDVRDKALLLIGFAGGFRRSELVALQRSNIEWTPEGIMIRLTRSKCDQEGRGRQVAISYARGSTCPVIALKAWLTVARVGEGPVFRGVDRHGNVANRRLSTEAVAHIVKERAAAAGMDPTRLSGHSLRAGLATSAATAGVETWKIRRQTGHASDATLQHYIRSGEQFSENGLGSLF